MSVALEPIPFPPYRELGNEALHERIKIAKQALGKSLLILGHHYQQDEVIEHADLNGDSYQLSKLAADSVDCRTIVFCGVHFMAETADILANRPEKLRSRDEQRVSVILPDMSAGCSMADMAGIRQVESAWKQLGEVIDTTDITPVTYINSAASLKAFCGRHGGIVCTSSNAKAVFEWAFAQRKRVFFFPDQHLGRNTSLKMGITNSQMPVWNPHEEEFGGNTKQAIEDSRVILWKGHCSVHQMFQAEHVATFRKNVSWNQNSGPSRVPARSERHRRHLGLNQQDYRDGSKSTSAGTKWAIGTELHLVNRLKKEHPEQEIHFLSPLVCMCATMYRIDLAHLCWCLENLVQGHVVNQIIVREDIANWSLIALERMLNVK